MGLAEGQPRQFKLRLRNRLTTMRHALSPWPRDPAQVHWLFVATFPNGGSTALAQLLASGKAAVKLLPNGEGQWLFPDLASDRRRWQADMPVDYGALRAVWLDKVRQTGTLPCVVIEKSPPGMMRMGDLMQAFGDMPTRLVRFTRDPYAVCSSWATRYGPQAMASAWGEDCADLAPGSAEFYRFCGELYGRRAQVLCKLADISDALVSYEELTGDTPAVLARLKGIEPLLADVREDASVAVKDYAPQPLANMNDRQIALLTEPQIVAIGEGLRVHGEAVSALGYEIR